VLAAGVSSPNMRSNSRLTTTAVHSQ
jgi:hypothetical protein